MGSNSKSGKSSGGYGGGPNYLYDAGGYDSDCNSNRSPAAKSVKSGNGGSLSGSGSAKSGNGYGHKYGSQSVREFHQVIQVQRVLFVFMKV